MILQFWIAPIQTFIVITATIQFKQQLDTFLDYSNDGSQLIETIEIAKQHRFFLFFDSCTINVKKKLPCNQAVILDLGYEITWPLCFLYV